jgi:hypothetical protein
MGVPTWDLEAVGWTVPVSIGFYDGFDYHEFLKRDEDDNIVWRFLEFLREHYNGIKLFAHYAGKYDNLFILQELCKRDEALTLQAGAGKLKWTKPNITFEDSYLLAPMKLDKLNKMLGVNPKQEWDHSSTLKPWEMGERLDTFRAYQKADCITLSESIHRLCEVIGGAFGVTPSITMATTAVKTLDKCFFDLDKVDSNEDYEEFIRKALYGARNEVYKRYGERINIYDVKDMYMSCYDTPMPTGLLTWIRPNIDRGSLAEAVVKIPKSMYIGPLPVRRGGSLIFPTGELTGWWDIYELRNAVKFKGVDLKIKRQLCAEELPILKEFGVFVSRLKGTTPLSQYWKLFGIAVSGKLGQSRWRDTIQHVSAVKNMAGCAPVDKNELYFRSMEYIKGHTPYIKPAVTMRVRAEARIRHLDFLLAALKDGEIFYGDTDSVFTTSTLPIGTKSGELNLINKAKRGYFIRQKLYGLVTKDGMVQRSAGYSDLKLTEEDFKKLLEGSDLEFMDGEMPNYRQVLNGKDLERIEGKKSLSSSFSSNRQSLGNDTEPIYISPKTSTPLQTRDGLASQL